MLIYLLITGGLTVLTWFLMIRSEEDPTAAENRYGKKVSLWQIAFYFSVLFFAIGVFAAFEK